MLNGNFGVKANPGQDTASTSLEKFQFVKIDPKEALNREITNCLVGIPSRNKTPEKSMDERLAEYLVSLPKIDPSKKEDVVKALNMMKIDFNNDKDQDFFKAALNEVLGEEFTGDVAMNRMDRSLAFGTKNGMSYEKRSDGGVNVWQKPEIPDDWDGEDLPPVIIEKYDGKGKLVDKGYDDEETGNWVSTMK